LFLFILYKLTTFSYSLILLLFFMRYFLALLSGMLVGYLVIFGIEMISVSMYPPPQNLNPMNYEDLVKMMETIPTAALLIIGLAHIAGTFTGGIVALLIAYRNKWVGYGFAGLMLALTVFNLITIPHPFWFVIFDICGVLFAAFLYLKLIAKRTK